MLSYTCNSQLVTLTRKSTKLINQFPAYIALVLDVLRFMKDSVFIKGLELRSLIGVYEFERHSPQRVIVDLELAADLSLAGKSDKVEDTIDYGAVAEKLGEIATKSKFLLLEALGEAMSEALFDNFNISQLTLTLNKPDIIANAAGVGITIRRSKN